MGDRRLGTLGRRLLAALMLTAVVAILVMVVGMLLTEQRVRSQDSADARLQVARTLAAVAAVEYQRSGEWDGVVVNAEQAGARADTVHVVVRDASGTIVSGGPVGPNFDARAVGAPVIVAGEQVGTVWVEARAGTGPPAITRLSHLWFVASAALAGVAALGVAYVLAQRMISPIDSYIATARAFAAGNHSARPSDLGPPEFREMTQALSAAADEIERSEAARRKLTADIAHELRTPLTALQAGLEELRDGYVQPDRETLSALHDQASRLGRIVGDLSALAAAESDGLELHLEPIDLGEVVRLAGSAWEVPLRSTGVSVEHDVPSGVVVLADRDRVQQILGNLLANAAAYCRSGDTVLVRVSTEGLLRVADTGPGFRAEDLPVVFERSWRGASAAGTQGTGLGLPIVRALAEAQGGSVQVQSEEGRGATITVRLPTATAPRSG